MSHLTLVNQTPTKKKRSPFKPQRNTLDRYFHAPKKSLACDPLNEDKKQDNEQNPVTRSKRKSQSTNKGVGVKSRKVDNTCRKKCQAAEGSVHTSTEENYEMYQAKVLLKRINNTNLNSKHLPTATSTVTVNHDGRSTATSETSDYQFCQNEIKSSEHKISLQRNETVEVNEANEMTTIANESFDLAIKSSINDSIEIDTISTPKQAELNQTSDVKHNLLLSMKEAKNIRKFPNKISIMRKSPLNKVNENSLEISKQLYDGQPLHCQERKKITATSFLEIIYSFCHSDFSKPYQKLSFSKLPQCCDLRKCRAMHEGARLKELNSFQYGHVFNTLDNPLSEWLCDVLPAISLVMSRHQYLRGDMLRIMFDYILNGPNEDLMWDIRTILETHWSLHPPCTEHMREVYLRLLDRRYPGESFFKTDLTNTGVLLHVMDQLEKVLKTEMDAKEICENGESNADDQPSDSGKSELTFEVLEERFNNHQPLLDNEQQETMDTADELANSSQIKDKLVVLEKSEILNRLTIASEVIVDLLEADFMICVSKLKNYMKEECATRYPLVKHFLDDSFHLRILKLYVATTNQSTWKQLSRLIGLMAETLHLFKHWETRMWKYPNLNSDCEDFASVVFEEFSKGGWDDCVRLSRLQALRPPWLRQRVTLAVANSHLNLDLGAGIQAVVDIIHTHVISPVTPENDLKKVQPDPKKLKMASEKLMKKSKKKNFYGESLLHQMCRQPKFTAGDVESVLALPETDVNARDNHGWTPLHEAINSMSLAKAELLLQFQPPPGRDAVDVGAQNNDGITPLHEAVEACSLGLCQLLVQYGGICLLRKKNNEGVTPLMQAKNREVIRKYFESVIKIQEELNLNSNSVLKLSDSMIRMCMVVCEAFIADHHTWELYQVLKYDKDYVRASPRPYVAASSKEILLEFKQDQDHFRKLRRILEKLAENPENSYLIRLWNDRFLCRDSRGENIT